MRRYATLLQTVAEDPDHSTQERVKGLVHAGLQARRADPVAHTFVLGHQQRFLSALPADFPYPIRIVDRLIQEGQADGTVKAGPVRVLSALVVGCLNQPAIVAQHAARGTIDLDSPGTADLIADGAWAAIAVEP
jgi:hypothetical protein